MARDQLSGNITFGPDIALDGVLIRANVPEPITDTPEGFSPEQFGLSFAGLEQTAADTARLQAAAPGPGVIPEDLPIDEKLAVLDRMESIRASVPGIDGAKLLSLAYHHTDISSAITAARAEAAAKPRSWWHHVVAPFKAVFIDAPEFAWRKIIVDPFQELAELVGVEPEIAQRLSPGQVVVAAIAQLPGDQSVEDEHGNILPPEEWDGALRWVSGGLDFAARLTMDPTLLLGKFRQTLALPGGAEKLLRLTRVQGAGRAARVARLQNIAFGTARTAGDAAKAQRIASEIVEGRRLVKNYLAGYVNLSDIARDVVAHSGVRSFVRDAVRAAEDSPDAVAHILRSYGSLRKGFGITVEHADYIADAASRGLKAGRLKGDAFAGGVRQAERAIVELITANVTPQTRRRVSELTAQHASAVALRNDALHVIEEFHANRAVDVVDIASVRRPRIALSGRVIAEEVELTPPTPHARPTGVAEEVVPAPRAPLPVDVPVSTAYTETLQAYVQRRVASEPTGTTGRFAQEHAESLRQALHAGVMVSREVLESSPSYQELSRFAETFGLVARRADDVGKANPLAQFAGVDVEASASRRNREQAGDFPPRVPGELPPALPDTGVGEVVPAREVVTTPREVALSEVETAVPSDVPMATADVQAAESVAQTYSDEIRRTAEKLRPYLQLTELDDDAIADVIHGWKTIENELHLTKPLGEFPYASVFGRAVNWLGDSPLRQVPLVRNLSPEYLPHRTLNVHDPHWHVQVTRLGRMFQMAPEEIEGYITRARSTTNPFGMRAVVEGMLDDGYARLGIRPDQLAELKKQVGERAETVFAVRDGSPMTRPVLESDQLNTVWLTDPKFIRMLMRRSGGQGFARMGIEEFRTAIIDSLDRFQAIIKRLMIAAPRTGLRVLMETQVRALAYGYSSAVADPFAWFDTFGLSVVSPQRALERLRGKAPEAVAEVAIGARDLGMSQLLHESGLLSASKWQARQVTKYKEMSSDWMRHQYRKAQANYINDHLLNDRLAREIVFGNPASAYTWLTGPQGSTYRTTMGLRTREAIDEQFGAVSDIVTQHRLAESKVRAVVVGRPGAPGRAITAEDLIGHEADAIVGANIHGAWAGDNLQEKVTSLLDRAVERNLASIEHIGRDYTSRRELWREVWDRVGKHRRKGATIDDETVTTLLRGGVVKREGTDLERAIVSDSKRAVFDRVKFLFFDMAEHSRASESLRFLFPFGNAYQEVVGTWAAILHERPWIPHLGAAMAGSVDDLPGLTYTDPATGEKMFRIPLSGHMLRFAGLRAPNPITGMPGELAYEFTGRLEGFNVVTAGFPIPGPYAQFSAWFLLRNKPQAQDMLEVLFPFGLGNWFRSMVPGWAAEADNLRDALTSYLGSEISNVDLAQVAADLGMEEVHSVIKRANALDDPQAARDALATLDDIDDRRFLNRLTFLFSIRAASRVFFPAVVRERSPIRDMIQFYRSVSQADPAFANAVFLARYGPEFLALVEERTERADPSVPPPTKEARRRLLSDPTFERFVGTFEQPAWDVLKEAWSGELDRDMLRDQILSGERRRRTLPEIRQAALSAVGWEYYFLYNDQLERRLASLGIASIQQADATPFATARDAFIGRLRWAFPDWAAEFASGRQSQTPLNIARLSIIANTPQLQGLESVVGLQKYFALRRQVLRHMQTLGLRSLDGQAALALKMGFADQVREIVRGHPAFARIWGRYLQRDDLTPLDQLLLRTGVIDQAGFLREAA